MAVETPHLAVPFTIGRNGTLVNEQSTPQERAACVYNTCVCPEGFRDDQPQFGVPDLTFEEVPVGTKALEDAIRRSEPEADFTAVEWGEALNEAARIIQVDVL